MLHAPPPPAQSFFVTSPSTLPTDGYAMTSFAALVIENDNAPVLTIRMNGTVELGPNVKPDDAAKCFWNFVQTENGQPPKFHNVKGCPNLEALDKR